MTVKVQLKERDIMRKALENMMRKGETNEARKVLLVLVATYIGVCLDAGKEFNFEGETGHKLPTIEQLMEEFCHDATKACKAATAMLDMVRGRE